ncbi:MAG: hypothetical protein ACE5JP_13100 [Candidatus Bipolaricaulia bacterium]
MSLRNLTYATLIAAGVVAILAVVSALATKVGGLPAESYARAATIVLLYAISFLLLELVRRKDEGP